MAGINIQWGECNRALRRMFVDGGLGIGAAVGIAVATGGLGVGVAAWIYAFSAAQLVLDRMEVDRVCDQAHRITTRPLTGNE